MADKGIIIDVGFRGEYKKFIDEIDREFQNIDFGKSLGMDKAFEEQEKKIRERVKALKKLMDEVLAGNPSDVPKQLGQLQSSVLHLSKAVKEMMQNADSSDVKKFGGSISTITNDINELTTSCQNAQDVIKDLGKNHPVKLVDEGQNEELIKEYRLLKNVSKEVENINKAYKNGGNFTFDGKKIAEFDVDDTIVPRMNELLNDWQDIDVKIQDVQDNLELSVKERTSLLDSYTSDALKKLIEVNRLYQTAYGLMGDKADNIRPDEEIKSTIVEWINEAQESFDSYLDYIDNRRKEIAKSYRELTGEKISDYFKKSTAKEEHIKVPVSLENGAASKLRQQTIEMIDQLSKELASHPIQITVTPVSSWANRENRKKIDYFVKRVEQLENGSGLSQSLSDQVKEFIGEWDSRTEKYFKFDIEIAKDNAKKKIDEFVAETKEELKILQQNLTFYPEVEITEETKQRVIQELRELSTELVITPTIDVKDVIIDNVKDKIQEALGGATETIEAQMENIDPLNKLSNAFDEYKKYFEADDLNSQLGAKAALDYYNAFKGALYSKVKKKELQQYVTGDINKLFTGNYKDFSRTGDIKLLDLTGINEKIQETTNIIKSANEIKLFDNNAQNLSAESDSLQIICQAVQDVIDKIEQKTEAFNTEGLVVKTTTENEIQALGDLYVKLNTIGQEVRTIKEIFDTLPKVLEVEIKPIESESVIAAITKIKESIIQATGEKIGLSLGLSDDLTSSLMKSLQGLYDLIGDTFDGNYVETWAKYVKSEINDINNRIFYMSSSLLKSFELIQNKVSELNSSDLVEIQNKFTAFYGEVKRVFSEPVTIEIKAKNLSKLVTDFNGLKKSINDIIENTNGSKIYDSLALPSKEKTKILNSIKKITTDVQKVFDTSSVQTWSTEVLGSFDNVKQKLIEVQQATNIPMQNMLQPIQEFSSELSNLKNIIQDVNNSISNISLETFKEDNSYIRNLSSAFTEYKKYYEANDLSSEMGAKAALNYYNAYKDALYSKVAKKDLKEFTIGSTDKLFTGNYKKYTGKNGSINDLNLDGINAEIEKTKNIILESSGVPDILNAFSASLNELLNLPNNTAEFTNFLDSLNKTLNNFTNTKADDKLTKFCDALDRIIQKVNELGNIQNLPFIQNINEILSKSDELKNLITIIEKSGNKAVKNLTKEQNFTKAADILKANQDAIKLAATNAIPKNDTDVILGSRATALKNGMVQVVTLIEKADKSLIQYTHLVDENLNAISQEVNDNAADLKKYADIMENIHKKENIGKNNLGSYDEVFTPDSDGWDQLVEKIGEAGHKLENVDKIIQHIDDIGQESFQVFSGISRVTIGMDSYKPLDRKTTVFDAAGTLEEYKRRIEDLAKTTKKAFSGDQIAIDEFTEKYNKLVDLFATIQGYQTKGIISEADATAMEERFNALKAYIESFKSALVFDKQMPEIQNLSDEVQKLFDSVMEGFSITEKLDGESGIVKLFGDFNKVLNTKNDPNIKAGNANKLTVLLTRITEDMKQNSNMSNELRTDYERLERTIQSFNGVATDAQIKDLNAQFLALHYNLVQTGKSGKKFIDTVAQRLSDMNAKWIAQLFSLHDWVNYIRSTANAIIELDTALVDLKKTTTMTSEELDQFYFDANKIAKQMGVTTAEIISQASAWSRFNKIDLLYGNV